MTRRPYLPPSYTRKITTRRPYLPNNKKSINIQKGALTMHANHRANQTYHHTSILIITNMGLNSRLTLNQELTYQTFKNDSRTEK